MDIKKGLQGETGEFSVRMALISFLFHVAILINELPA